jgi:hypothetical protein
MKIRITDKAGSAATCFALAAVILQLGFGPWLFLVLAFVSLAFAVVSIRRRQGWAWVRLLVLIATLTYLYAVVEQCLGHLPLPDAQGLIEAINEETIGQQPGRTATQESAPGTVP